MKRTFVLALVAALATLAVPAQAAKVSGVVVDREGKPIEYANVIVIGQRAGALTDEHGRFALELEPGQAVLEVVQMGFQRSRLAIVVADGAPEVRLVMAHEPVPVAEVTVAASSFGKTGKSEGAVVRRMDVYMTPGGAGDIFQSLRALPGINAPAEGAALYVRGGDPSETVIRIDSGDIGHPYHYEGASGGLFSIIDTYMLKSAFFSSGGFSSKYGGALSGVLDIETQDPMNLRTVSVGANVASGQVSSTWALVPDQLSLLVTMNQSWPAVLFKLYGQTRDYERAPSSFNGASKLLWRYSPTGRLALIDIGSTESIAVKSNRLNFADIYTSRAGNDFYGLQWQDVIVGRVALRGNLSGQAYRSNFEYGAFAKHRDEDRAQGTLDALWPIGTRHELSFGANYRRNDTRITGYGAADSTNLASGAPVRLYGTDATTNEPGVYFEDKLRLFGPVYATVGGRLDYASLNSTWTADPRAALAWRLDEHQTLRVAGGRYHQLPDPQYLDPVYGNPRLEPMTAIHSIAGYEWKSDFGNVRLEGYRKDYRNLITNEAATFYGNRGTGYARGVDAFVQGTYQHLSGWVSYGFLDTRRRQFDDTHEVPAIYGVRHSVTLVGQFQLSSKWQTGLRYSHATGRPFTPVVGRTYDAGAALWRPTFGDHNSENYPDYNRVDLRATRLFSLPAGLGLPQSNICVLYVEAMNLLATPNVLEYVYNSDYSQRYTTLSYFSRRFVVAGFSLSW